MSKAKFYAELEAMTCWERARFISAIPLAGVALFALKAWVLTLIDGWFGLLGLGFGPWFGIVFVYATLTVKPSNDPTLTPSEFWPAMGRAASSLITSIVLIYLAHLALGAFHG